MERSTSETGGTCGTESGRRYTSSEVQQENSPDDVADSVRSNLLTFLSGFHMNRIDLKTTRGNIELSGSPATGHNKMGDQCDLPLIAGPSTTDQQPLGQRMVSPE